MLKFLIDLDMFTAQGERDNQIAAGVVARDRSRVSGGVVSLVYQSCRPHAAMAGAVEDIDSRDVHPGHPFGVDRRDMAVYPAGTH